MLNEYDVIKLKKSIPEKNLYLGDKGTILIVYDVPGLPCAYEVEFLDKDGKTLAILTLRNEDVEKI